MAPRKFPDSFIPALQNEAEFEKWRKSDPTYRESDDDISWGQLGNKDFATEFTEGFGPHIWQHSVERMKQNKGKLKIVSFGGGELLALLDLRELLMNEAQREKLEPKIKIVEFSLTKKLANKSLKATGYDGLVESGELELHMGPLQVRDLGAAEGADVELSRYGPFHHEPYDQYLVELVEKAAVRLAPGGKAFFHAARSRPEQVLTGIKQALDQNKFLVEYRAPNEAGKPPLPHYEITRLENK
jgi:hypothetical protein